MANVNKKSTEKRKARGWDNKARDSKASMMLQMTPELRKALTRAVAASTVHSTAASLVREILTEYCKGRGYI
jgi:hypothetical protein